MSFNISDSKFVTVSDRTMRLEVSDKIIFADLRTSRKTGNPKTDENGVVITDAKGNPIPERIYEHWEGRFVGQAFEYAKGLQNGQAIDIKNGWIEKRDYVTKGGAKGYNVYVVVSDFSISDTSKDEEEDETARHGDADVIRAMNGDAVPI